jgi:hypothetical protein
MPQFHAHTANTPDGTPRSGPNPLATPRHSFLGSVAASAKRFVGPFRLGAEAELARLLRDLSQAFTICLDLSFAPRL